MAIHKHLWVFIALSFLILLFAFGLSAHFLGRLENNRAWPLMIFPLGIALIVGTGYVISREYDRKVKELDAMITAIREKEQALSNLQRSNTELEQFAYIASHDLQEPLRKIQAFGHRLLTKLNGEFDREAITLYSTKMVKAAERMQHLVLNLLEFSRVAKNHEQPGPVDLNKVLENVLEDMEERILEENAHITFSTLPVLSKGRESQLFQLFLNLTSNAVKFKKAGRPLVIDITCSEGNKTKWSHLKDSILPEGVYYQILFADNGLGFDPKYSEQIFTIFQRLHSRAEFEGTGIGLSICQHVCENHGGKITAESIPDSGSMFYVYLPKRDV